jgi:competence protein ComEC
MAADTVAVFLLSQGITNLDALILTHYDRDHFGGVEIVLSRVGTELVILPPVDTPWNPDAGQILYATEDLLLSAENTKISIYTSGFPGNGNENSLCILFDTENCDILITGDRDEFGERMLLRHHMIPDVDILVAGHHGSRFSSGEDLLAAARPEIVCISAGAGNRFGHPEPELLQRLETHGCTVYRTDLQGNIIIRR